MPAISFDTSTPYDVFIAAWNTGSIGLDELNDALKKISSTEDRVVASRLFYAIRRGWLHLHTGQSSPSATVYHGVVPYGDRVSKTCRLS
ncbi:hypothetical protein [Baaleninema simplex]|uniref:hypothetical protein n=1 Tax=Baaleninema simplex TaxID=2862350 RepID=UPI00037DCC9C|nr:hypothetical protein [Baaleninema simplex]